MPTDPGHDKRAPPEESRPLRKTSEGPACQVRWSYPASYCGRCFSTRNGHDKRAPPQNPRGTCFGGICLSGPYLGKVERDKLSPLIRWLGRKIEKNCSRRGKSTLFAASPAGRAFSRPFGSPVNHARWEQRNGLGQRVHAWQCGRLFFTMTDARSPANRRSDFNSRDVLKIVPGFHSQPWEKWPIAMQTTLVRLR